MMNRTPTPQQLPPHDPRERRLVAHLHRQGITITRGWLIDQRHQRTWQHGRIVEKVRTA